MIKLVVSDFDKTLLPRGKIILDGHTIQAIKNVLQRNIYFAISSGRSYKELKQFIQKEAYEIFFICENGALIIYHGAIWNKYSIERNKAISFVNEVEKSGYHCLISGVYTLYTTSKDNAYLNYLKKIKGTVVKIKNVRDLPEEALKISIFRKNTKNMQDSWIREISEELHISYYGKEWIDFTEKGIHKGSAVEEIKEFFLKKDEKIMAFGDHDNDKEMLLMADYSYAMEDSNEEIIRICNDTTENPIKTIEKILKL